MDLWIYGYINTQSEDIYVNLSTRLLGVSGKSKRLLKKRPTLVSRIYSFIKNLIGKCLFKGKTW